ncbi:MAG: ribonuclease P protein component [Bacteroidales bacterium]|jgi:ribonuclease P protein component
MNQTFTKDERLCRKLLISKLFREGNSFYIHPFRVLFMFEVIPVDFPVQLLISVPKQNLKKAVDRNKIKRRISEAWRINKHILYEQLTERQRQMAVSIIYTASEILPSYQIREKIILILLRLREGHAKITG